jgi:signal peptidase II
MVGKNRFIIKILIFALATDQLSKLAAIHLLSSGNEVKLLLGTIQFSLVYNSDGFLSILSGTSDTVRFILLNICVGGLLCGCLYYLFLYPKSRQEISLPLAWVTAGGLSNLLDRSLHSQGVIDFASFGIGNFRTGILNLADIYITVGSISIGYFLAKK